MKYFLFVGGIFGGTVGLINIIVSFVQWPDYGRAAFGMVLLFVNIFMAMFIYFEIKENN